MIIMRPLPLLLGILYKVQESLASSLEQIQAVQHETVSESEELSALLGHYWNLIRLADTSIRHVDHQEEEEELTGERLISLSKRQYAETLSIPEEQVVWVWSSKALNQSSLLSDHVPEHMITVDHHQKAVILTLLGTKVFPAPQPLDIIMDLMATAESFQDGVAHGGIGVGTRNLVETAVPVIKSQLELHPSYSLLVLGYSLGAGLAQLLTLHCQHSLPPDTVIRTIAFGSPPVFARQGEQVVLENVFLVQNDEDGISGASLRNVYDLLNRACLVHTLNIKRRNLLKLLFSEVVNEEDRELIDFQDDEHDDGSEWIDYDQLETDEGSVISDIWTRIKETLGSYSSNVEEPELHHLGGTFLVLRRSDEDVIEAEKYQGFEGTELFARQLILKGSMISDHMPGAYNHLFEKYQNIHTTNQIPSLDVLDRLLPKAKNTEVGFRSKLKKKIKRVFDFFKDIGK